MENELDKLLEAEGGKTPELSTRLMENIIADAAMVSADRQIDRPLVIETARISWWKRLLEPIGGMPALAAAAACAVFGVFIGYSGTDSLQSIPGMDGMLVSFEDDPIDDLSIGILANFDNLLTEG